MEGTAHALTMTTEMFDTIFLLDGRSSIAKVSDSTNCEYVHPNHVANVMIV